MKKPAKWNNLLCLGYFAVLCSTAGHAGALDYFPQGIDFWNKTSPSPLPAQPTTQTEPFPWKTYLDPAKQEFFQEGNYLPPAPFMELVRNPNDENIRNWFSYMNKKNELSRKLQERIRAFVAQNSSQAPAPESLFKPELLHTSHPQVQRYRFRLYFDSHCPHCRKMLGTLGELQKIGFFVEARQVDNDPKGIAGYSVPITRVAPGEVQSKDVQSVPVLFIGDLQKKEVYRLTGYQPLTAVLTTLAHP